MKRDPRGAAVISILTAALVARSAYAMVFNVLPVTINTLTHQNFGGSRGQCDGCSARDAAPSAS